MAAIKRFQVYGIREIYHELGSYEFKIVLNPRFHKSAHDFKIDLIDSAGKSSIPFDASIWGRKIQVKFNIGPLVPDGVASFTFSNDRASYLQKFWVIKPDQEKKSWT